MASDSQTAEHRIISSPLQALPGPLTAVLLFALLAGAARADKDLVLKLPTAGAYQVWLEAETTSGVQPQAPVRVNGDRAALPLSSPPAGLKEWRVLALDESSGYVAARSLPAKDTPAQASFATPDFSRVHRVRVQVTGAGEKPVAGASVTLRASKGESLSRVIDASASGTADFTDVPSGGAKLTVTTAGGKSTTKDIDINLAKGDLVQSIAVPLPEVTAVIEPTPAASTATPAATSVKPGEGTASSSKPTESGSKGSDTAPTPIAPAPAPAPAPSGGNSIGSLIGLILVLGLVYWGYLHARNQGWTLDQVLARLGVQPVSPVPAGNAPAAPAPAAPPVDPSVCAFCGQRKDPVTGNCACSLDGFAAGSAAPAGPAFASSGSGPRLVAVSGLAMGQIFPVTGEAAIGRDPGNAVSLSMDSTVSRRHAVIAPEADGFVIRDQGSSNGTFVNGARITEAPIRPGDEVSIGGTRFRFEA